MVWITSEGKHIPVSQMDSTHLKNTINYLMNNHKPSCTIYGIQAKVWVKCMSKELNDRKIAQIENDITALRKKNEELRKQFDKKIELLAILKADNNVWDEFKF